MRYLLAAMLMLAASNSFSAPTVDLTVSPTSGASPLTVTLSWTSTGATSCLAADGWAGNKATSGSQVITGVSATTTYTLTCSDSSGQVAVTWNPPTTNTDGST